MSKPTPIETISDEYGTELADAILDALQRALRHALDNAAHHEAHGETVEDRRAAARLARRFQDALYALTKE